MKPINIRITSDLDNRVDHAADKTGLPKADVMRLALSIGMKDLEMMGYDIDGAIYDRVMKAKGESQVVDAPQAKPPASGRERESDPIDQLGSPYSTDATVVPVAPWPSCGGSGLPAQLAAGVATHPARCGDCGNERRLPAHIRVELPSMERGGCVQGRYGAFCGKYGAIQALSPGGADEGGGEVFQIVKRILALTCDDRRQR